MRVIFKEFEQAAEIAEHVFGPGVVVTGTAGTADVPGQIVIHLHGHAIGRGETFREALRQAQQTLTARVATTSDATRPPTANAVQGQPLATGA